MNINILRYSLFGTAGGQEVDYTFVKFIIYPLTMIVLLSLFCCIGHFLAATNIQHSSYPSHSIIWLDISFLITVLDFSFLMIVVNLRKNNQIKITHGSSRVICAFSP